MDRHTLYMTIIASVLLHAGVMTYVVMTWGIVPAILEEPEVEVIAMVPPPAPPPPPEVTDVTIQKPRFRPRPVPPPPVRIKQVKPIPLKPQPPAKSTADATTIVADKAVPAAAQPAVSNVPPRAASKPPPTYPDRAVDADKEGVVQVRITIQPNGAVSEAAIVAARPAGWFETAALSAVKRWRYESSGRISTTVVEIEFKLD
jgi:periplasmic protein TonB